MELPLKGLPLERKTDRMMYPNDGFREPERQECFRLPAKVPVGRFVHIRPASALLDAPEGHGTAGPAPSR
jgi:hypothetical protein